MQAIDWPEQMETTPRLKVSRKRPRIIDGDDCESSAANDSGRRTALMEVVRGLKG